MDFDDGSYKDFFDKLRSNTGGPSNLQQIFEDDSKALQNESNNSHKHQSQHKSSQQRSAADKSDAQALETWSTVIAKVAHGFNGSDNVGRVGVALSRNGAGDVKLIVYKTKSLVLSTLLLTGDAGTQSHNVILRESYMQFYDDEQRFWSVRFDDPKDETEFTKSMQKLGLMVKHLTNDSKKSVEMQDKPALASPPKAASSTRTIDSILFPQPKPRTQQKHTKPSSAIGTAYADSSDEQLEDVIVTPILPNMGQLSKTSSHALLPLISSSSSSTNTSLMLTPAASTTPNVDKLGVYIKEQRVSGHMMEKKMDSILKAVTRLATNNTSQHSESFDSTIASTATSPVHDNEDELLDLEQKLLNFKRENRALMKSLKAKEQALANLRSSTCALCEELLAQNNELKQQNTALLAAMTAQIQGGGNNCEDCEHSAAKIAKLEHRVMSLQKALLNYSGSEDVDL